MLKPLQTDAKTDSTSSNESDAKGQESSTAEQDATQGQESSTESTETTETDGAEAEQATSTEATGEQQQADGQQDGQQQQQEQEAAPEVVLDKPEDAQLEYHKSPRFQELIKEKNTARQELETLKPLAERAKILDSYVQTNQIPAQELTNALEYLRLRRQDPVKAYEMIKVDYERLATLAGDRLPEDLHSAVTAGTLDVGLAKELAKSRVMQQHQQWMQQGQQQTVVQQQEQMVQGAINTWTASTMQRDTALKPGTDLWNQVDMRLRTLRQANPPSTMEQAVKLTEQAYNESKAFMKKFSPAKPTTRPPLKAGASTANSAPIIKDAKDVVKAIMSGKRPHELRYS